MGFHNLHCASCGRNPLVDDESDTCYCMYCGQRLSLEEVPDARFEVKVKCSRSMNFPGKKTFEFEIDGVPAATSVTGKTVTFMLLRGKHSVKITIPHRRGSDSNVTEIEVSRPCTYKVEFGAFNMDPTLIPADSAGNEEDSFF